MPCTQAAAVLPTSGNPYNQMAVVAYYASDEMRAVGILISCVVCVCVCVWLVFV